MVSLRFRSRFFLPASGTWDPHPFCNSSYKGRGEKGYNEKKHSTLSTFSPFSTREYSRKPTICFSLLKGACFYIVFEHGTTGIKTKNKIRKKATCLKEAIPTNQRGSSSLLVAHQRDGGDRKMSNHSAPGSC